MATKTETKTNNTVAVNAEPVNAISDAVKKAEPAAKKAATTRKTSAKKTATTKKTTAKKEMKVNAVVQYYGQQVEEKTIIANVKKAWTKSASGNKVGDIKTVELYIKPEENAVYYVVNGKDSGAVALF